MILNSVPAPVLLQLYKFKKVPFGAFSLILIYFFYMSIYFITGTSGSGKTTLMNSLKEKLPTGSFRVYDFDENGVPENPSKEWRQETTDKWIQISNKNELNKISTVICGVSVPSEILNSPSLNKDIDLVFGILHADDEVIKSRLKERGWSDQLIQDNLNWAHHLEKEVLSQPKHYVFESSSSLNPKELANSFIKFINIPEELKINSEMKIN